MWRRLSFVLVAWSAVWVTPSWSRAQEQAVASPASSREHGHMGIDGNYLLLGPTLSMSVDRSGGQGVALGAEVSVTSVKEQRWLGAYVDALHGFAADETRLSVGPELGFAIFGVDAGYLLTLGGNQGARHGVALRPMLTIGFASAYFRSSWLLGEHPDWFGELGLMLKLPMPVSNEPWF
jgi:hypothetical protein